MEYFEKLCIRQVLYTVIAIHLVGCGDSGTYTPRGDGIGDFQKAVALSYDKLQRGKVVKKKGFYNECSVDWAEFEGIRISETVCDLDLKSRRVTIRITDPTSRPPSYRLNSISIAAEINLTITVRRGTKQELPNGINVKLDRTGQSVELERVVESE